MSKEPYEQLLEQIQEQEHAVQQATRVQRGLEHELKEQRALAAKRHSQLKTIQTLSLGIFSRLDTTEIYELTCQTVVHQLQWDAAFIVNFTEQGGELLASYQATQKQLDHLRSYLGTSKPFLRAYTQRIALSTYDSTDTDALALSSLFQTDHVVAMPILFGEQLYGYLVACSHTQQSKDHGREDIDFLAILASQIGHAIQNSFNFASLEEQNTRLRELDELKDSFISITSHQLRTPLSIMKWILSILESDKALAGLKEQLHLIQQAYVSNERLIHVVNDLLNVSRIREGKLPFSPQLTDPRVEVEEICKGSEILAKDRGVKLEWSFAEKLPYLSLDTILFKEALQNLLDNAIDYNRPDGWVKVALKAEEGNILLTITNTGPGIAKDEVNQIFNQFFRGDAALKAKPSGSGLGLYLTQAIIREHGGEIHCRSVPGEETTFTIILPVPKGKTAPATEDQPAHSEK